MRMRVKYLLLCLLFLAPLSDLAGQDKYAVLIGVESYDPSVLATLEFAEDDAIGLCQSLTSLGFKTKVMTGQSRVSTGKPTTPDKILRVLRTQMNNCASGDTLVISLSGHGLQFGSDKPDANGIRETYFCPEDADPNNKDTLLPISSVIELLKQCEADRKLFLVDACRNEFANTSGQKKAARKLKLSSVHETRQSVPGGTTILYSCAPKQFSFEDADLEHSVFSYFVINFLNGNAESRYYDGDNVGLDSLTRYVRKKTNEYVADNNLSADGQTPVFSGTSTDWILGKGINPIRKIICRHLDWRGGLEKIRRIKSLSSTNAHTMTTPDRTINFNQEVLLKNEKFYIKNFFEGRLHGEFANVLSHSWERPAGGVVEKKNAVITQMEWLINHPFALVEMLDRTDELRLSKGNVDGTTVDVISLKIGGENYVKWLFDRSGELLELRNRYNEIEQVSTFGKYHDFAGVKFWMHAKYVAKGPDPNTDIDRVTNLRVNVDVDDGIFDIPGGSTVASNSQSFDIDAMIEDYNMFKQEYVQPYTEQFGNILSDVQFSKLNSNTILINLRMNQNLPTGSNLTEVRQLVPAVKQQLKIEMADSERAAVRAGLRYDFRFTTPNGFVPVQFLFTANDL